MTQILEDGTMAFTDDADFDVNYENGNGQDVVVAGMEAAPAVSLSQVRKELIEQVGIDPSKLNTMRMNWSQSLKRCVEPSVTSKRWRGTVKLTGEDLGIGTVGSDKFKLGRKVMLPAVLPTSAYYDSRNPDRTYSNFFESLERTSRERMNGLCIKTEIGMLMSVKNFQKWRTIFPELQEKAFAMFEEMIQDWDLIVDAIVKEYTDKEAQDAFERYCAVNFIAKSGEHYEEFMSSYEERIRQQMPTAQQFRDRFVFDDSYKLVALPSMLAADEAEAARIREDYQVDGELNSLEAEKLREERIALRATNDDLEAEVEAMRQVVIEKAMKEQEALQQTVIDEMLIEMRQRTVDVATTLLSKVTGETGKIHPRSVDSVRNMIEWVRGNNEVLGDEQMAAMMDEVEIELNRSVDQDVAGVMERVSTYCATQIESIQRTGRTGAATAVPVEVEAPKRQSRRAAAVAPAVAPVEVEAPKRRGRRAAVSVAPVEAVAA